MTRCMILMSTVYCYWGTAPPLSLRALEDLFAVPTPSTSHRCARSGTADLQPSVFAEREDVVGVGADGPW